MSRLTFAEMETVIRWDRESDVATVYTHDSGLITQLEKRGFVAVFNNVFGGRVVAKSFEVPKNTLSVGLKPKRSAAQAAASKIAAKRLNERKVAQELMRSEGVMAPAAAPSPSQPGRASK